ncbi:MAG: D-alanine--D-serine ligase VanG [Bacteroides sp.]|nr:D-alanine--D-serine ligase VanG [Bacteroides sp.]
MERKKTAVLFGGCSSEYEVSLQSAYSVLKGLNKEKLDIIPIGISKKGDWYRYKGSYENIRRDQWESDRESLIPVTVSLSRSKRGLIELGKDGTVFTELDLAFPVLHGKNGEDGSVHGLLQLAGIETVGCSALSSALCMDKHRAHALVGAAGIRVPESALIKRSSGRETAEALHPLKYPVFVKPLRAGSSLGVSMAGSAEELREALRLAFCYDSEAVIEERIEGFEVGCAVIGSGDPIVGRVDEIELESDFFDYTEKYALKTSKIHMPARIDSLTEKRIQSAAVKIFGLLGCSDFARVDMFLTPCGEIVFNEVNTIPGFTAHSRFPNMMRGIGLSFEETLEKITETHLK